MRRFPLLHVLSAVRILLWFLPALTAHAQEDFYHPELEWHTIETKHFLVHYHDGAERTGQVVAKIAEEIFEPVTSFYNHVPDEKVSFVIKDHDDISNGAAYFFENRIEIYAPSMDFELRGTHNWLRNVVTHEFTHVVQIQTSMKLGRKVPSIYFQWLNYEHERRPDVLYGYPNVIVSYPVSGFAVPAWFAEGVAQYNRKELRYDFWDTHRDMILRSYALDGNMLSWEQMGVFGKTSLGNESSYNAGFAFVSYIAQTYGEEKLAEISRNLSSFGVVTIDKAIAMAIGKSGDAVYDEWRDALRKDYAARVQPIKGHVRKGEPLTVDSTDEIVNPRQIEDIETMMRPRTSPFGGWTPEDCQLNATVGFANLYPVFSPDGKKVAYVSAKGGDYFSLSSLYVYDFEKHKEVLIQAAVRTAPSWSPDGSKLYYAKLTRRNPNWSLQYDVYVYDRLAGEETRLTHGARAITPAIAPDTSRIVFVVNADGTSNLATSALDGSGLKIITPFHDGEQVYNPKWSPSGDRIVFDYSMKDGRDIAWIRPDGTDLQFLVSGPDDERCPSFTPDGSKILFSSDRTGIFNIYALDLTSRAVTQITSVLGGAFYPTMNRDGELLYSLYTSDGYKIYRLEESALPPVGGEAYRRPAGFLPYPYGATSPALADEGPQFNWTSLRAYNDSIPPAAASRPYKNIFTSLMIVPFLRIDNYNPTSTGIELLKPGVYLFSNDILEKTGFFVGAAMNARLERDLFLIFDYRGRVPLFYQLGLQPVASAELYNVTRKSTGYYTLPSDTIPVGVTYNLLEFDFALNQRALSQFSNVEFRYAHSRYTASSDNFIIPSSQVFVKGLSDLYLIANTFTLTLTVDAILPSRTQEINPVGRRVILKAARELNKFNGDGEYTVTAIGLQPVYKPVNFTRLELNWREYLPFFFRNQTITASLHGGTILGPPVDPFFDFYAGGMVGMKGYPFYSLGGNEMLAFGLSYRFPIINNIDLRVFQVYFDKLYASVYADIGNAWTGSVPAADDFKKDVGMQLRLETFSFYAFPTRIFFDAAYGLDRFSRTIPNVNQTVAYGKEWNFYFGILFGFDLD